MVISLKIWVMLIVAIQFFVHVTFVRHDNKVQEINMKRTNKKFLFTLIIVNRLTIANNSNRFTSVSLFTSKSDLHSHLTEQKATGSI